MAAPRVTLRPADGETLRYVEALLAESGLPTDDVRDPAPAFYLAYADGDPVGVGGLETAGEVGLLRSVVVDRDHRGRGLGTSLCERLESRAAVAGIDALYLLTTDAAAFFAARGYERVDRDEVPDAVADTRQFRELCSETATCMGKRLG